MNSILKKELLEKYDINNKIYEKENEIGMTENHPMMYTFFKQLSFPK